MLISTKKLNCFNITGMFAVLVLLLTSTGNSVAQSADAKTIRLTMEARLTAEEPPIESGLEWQIYQTKDLEKGDHALLAKAQGGTKSFNVSPGAYYVHVSYGYASVIRKIEIVDTESFEVFVFNAGALQLEAVTAPDGPIISTLLRFDVFAEKADERGIRPLIARNVRPMQVVPFPAGTYHVVSRYGSLNVETRADLHVKAGKLTQATMQHRAALISFRLVRQSGDGAIADTSWSILAENGDVIKESNSIFPSLVLSEGNYTAIARNNEKIYSHDFKVESGLNHDIEVLAE